MSKYLVRADIQALATSVFTYIVEADSEAEAKQKIEDTGFEKFVVDKRDFDIQYLYNDLEFIDVQKIREENENE